MAKQQPPRGERTLVFRLWRETSDHAETEDLLRVSVQDLHTGARRGFASLDAFLAYLSLVCDEDSGHRSRGNSAETDS